MKPQTFGARVFLQKNQLKPDVCVILCVLCDSALFYLAGHRFTYPPTVDRKPFLRYAGTVIAYFLL